MEKRKLGKSGVELSAIGFGGIVVKNETADNAAQYVSMAIGRGVNYFDVAPEYGNAQEMLGPALEPYRKNVFLACKTHEMSAKGAEIEFKDSQKKLKTDYFDLYQIHQVTTMEEVGRITGPGGALEFFVKMKEKGFVRHLGFTAHCEEAAVALMDLYDFTSILFPINWALWYKDGYGPAVMEKALEKGVGVLAMKALAKGLWPDGKNSRWKKCWYEPMDEKNDAALALRFSLSKPVTSCVSPSHAELLWMMCDIADEFTPLTAEEENYLKKKSAEINSLHDDLLVPYEA